MKKKVDDLTLEELRIEVARHIYEYPHIKFAPPDSEGRTYLWGWTDDDKRPKTLPNYPRDFSAAWEAAKKVLEKVSKARTIEIIIRDYPSDANRPQILFARLSWQQSNFLWTDLEGLGTTESECLCRVALKVACGEEIEV